MSEKEDFTNRLTSNEADIQHLTKDVKSLADQIGMLSRDFREAIAALQRSQNESSKPQWGVLAAWAGVVILLMTNIASPYKRDVERNSARIESNGVAILKHIEESPSSRELELVRENFDLKISNLKQEMYWRTEKQK